MQRELSRRRLLASTGLLASGAAVAAAAGASSRGNDDGFDELPVRWNRTYGEDPVTTATGVAEGDGQYVGVGSTGTQTEQTGWAFGADASSGEGAWDRPLENDEFDTQPTFRDAVAVDGGGYLLLGNTALQGRLSLVRTTPNGDVRWWETFTAEASDGEDASLVAQSLTSTEEGFVVGGYRVAGQDITAVTLTANGDGNEVTRTRYFEDRNATILEVRPAGEGFVAAGELQAQASGDEQPPYRGNLYRVGSDRSVQWQSDFGGEFDGETGQSQFQDVVPVDGGYVAVGNVITSGGVFKGWAVRTDDGGTGQSSGQVTPQSLTLLTAATRSEDGVVVAGQVAESATSQTTGAWVGELDDSNAIRWGHSVAPSDQNLFRAVTATDDGGVVAAGSAQSNDTNADPLARALLTKLGGAEAPDLTETGPTPEATPSPTPEPTATPTEEPTPTPTEEPTPSPTPSPTTTATPTAESEDGVETPTPRPTETSPGSGPGFGVGTALAALGTGALLRRSGLLGDSDGE